MVQLSPLQLQSRLQQIDRWLCITPAWKTWKRELRVSIPPLSCISYSTGYVSVQWKGLKIAKADFSIESHLPTLPPSHHVGSQPLRQSSLSLNRCAIGICPHSWIE